MASDNPIVDALEAGQLLMDQIMKESEDILSSKAALSIGAGLAAAGMARYLVQHPELIKTALEQVGEALEISGNPISNVVEGFTPGRITDVGSIM